MSCICGAPANGGPLCRRCAALAVLELKSGATENEIRAAYRVMVKVWHPDRFPGDEPLRKAAEARLKEINAAFQFLGSVSSPSAPGQSSSGETPAPSQPPAPSDSARTSSGTTGGGAEARQASRADSPSASGSAPRSNGQNWRQAQPRGAATRRATSCAPRRTATVYRYSGGRLLFLRWLALVLLLLLTRYVWIAFDFSDTSRDDTGNAQNPASEGIWRTLEQPKQRFVDALKKDIHSLGFRRAELPLPVPEEQETMPRSPRRANMQRPTKGPEPSRASDDATYITVGTTREQVLEQLGNPTRASRNVFVYDRSELYFRGDNVVGWRIDPASSPIQVKLWPRTFVDPDLNVFGAGSSKDEVLAIQGTPTALTEDQFEYGRSQVYFKNDQVVGWKNDLTSIPLHIENK